MLNHWQPKIRLRILFLATFVLAALLPAAFLAIWVISGTTQREMNNTADKQVALARTFALSLDRYAADRILVFEQCAEAYLGASGSEANLNLAAKSDFLFFILIRPDASTILVNLDKINYAISEEIANISSKEATPQTKLLPLVYSFNEKPTFFIVKKDPGGTVFAGALATSVVREMQSAVSFGIHGHAVVVDQSGKVIAHPKRDWETSLKSLINLEPVQHAVRGETGSAEFYAPARSEMALSGFTRARVAGWGVLMVRPLAEVNELAWQSTRVAIQVIAVTVVIAFIIAWLMSRIIVRPVERAAATARSLSQGKLSARFDPVPEMPVELGELGSTLNLLAERIDSWRQTAAETLSTVKAADQAKRDFLATLSHEVRTPLNAIIGFGELAQMETGQPGQTERRREYAANIVTAGRHLLRLIDEILDMAAIEAGHSSLENEAIDLAYLVNEVSTLLDPAALSHQVTMAVDLPPEMPEVIGDRLKLRQILLNLMGNAIKFTPKGGNICISAARSGCGGLRVSIADNGVGMSPDEIKTALTPFGRVRNKQTKSEPGTGLGLPLARRLIEAMNGRFELQSEPNKGTEVSITLPTA